MVLLVVASNAYLSSKSVTVLLIGIVTSRSWFSSHFWRKLNIKNYKYFFLNLTAILTGWWSKNLHCSSSSMMFTGRREPLASESWRVIGWRAHLQFMDKNEKISWKKNYSKLFTSLKSLDKSFLEFIFLERKKASNPTVSPTPYQKGNVSAAGFEECSRVEGRSQPEKIKFNKC